MQQFLGTPAVRILVRVLGAALLLGTAWIHQHLDDIGYSTVPTIGPLFRLDAALALLAALAVLLTPGRWWRLACAGGALLQLGTLAALGQSLTVGAFGFHETLDAPYVPQAVAVELAGFVVLMLGVLAAPPVPSIARVEPREDRVRDGERGRVGE